MTFHVGQKVVCVETWDGHAWPDAGYGDEVGPVRGTIYTIRGFDNQPHYDSSPAVYLEEIRNPVRQYWCNGRYMKWEQSFAIRRFRPVVEPKTDISIFTAMLTPKKAKEPA